MKYDIILTHCAEMPKRKNITDSGMDIRARGYSKVLNNEVQETVWFDESDIKYVFLQPNERILIKSGIQIIQPKYHEKHENGIKITDIQVRPRSGLALKNGITVLNSPGTVDQDYQGDIGVILLNTSDSIFKISEDDRIAQILFTEVIIPDVSNFNIVTEIVNKTNRGDNGFGSSGIQ